VQDQQLLAGPAAADETPDDGVDQSHQRGRGMAALDGVLLGDVDSSVGTGGRQVRR
jgi:hypothetical protein